MSAEARSFSAVHHHGEQGMFILPHLSTVYIFPSSAIYV
jgi:hypothetical protein